MILLNANAEGASGVMDAPPPKHTSAKIIIGPCGSKLIEVSFAGGYFAFEHDSPERRAAIKRNFGCEVQDE